jgi:CHAT domain-containing protein
VRWQDLDETAAIDNAVDSFRQALRDPSRKDVRKLAHIVDEKIMRPVRTMAGDSRHLFISPDGDLNLLPFGALVDDADHYLIENYSFTYLTSGRDLLRLQVPREPKTRALIVADPTFGETTGLQTQVIQSTIAHPSATTTRDLSQVYFAPLTGTSLEANSIHTLFPDALLLDGPNATETAIKGTAAPRILHIATHGFFLQDKPDATQLSSRLATRSISATVKIENPLLRSGLALAGANRRSATDDDGILTALEASGLNLWGTKLVVLSACDTGVGEIRTGEGVYGLRRAFVLAGAESLVMSLWPASDYTTRKLMTEYYRNLKLGKGRGEALRDVQLSMLRRNPKLHPFYWANFIQSGEWANLQGQRPTE